MTRRNYATQRNATPPEEESAQKMGRVLEVLKKPFTISAVRERLATIKLEEDERLARKLASIKPLMDLGDES
jgi:hypothetical protein